MVMKRESSFAKEQWPAIDSVIGRDLQTHKREGISWQKWIREATLQHTFACSTIAPTGYEEP